MLNRDSSSGMFLGFDQLPEEMQAIFRRVIQCKLFETGNLKSLFSCGLIPFLSTGWCG